MIRGELIPSAHRLMESLRDIGYDLQAAVADIVDNSIDADAQNVRIDVGACEGQGWLRIADDGIGMSDRRLDEAMRYGSSRGYGDSELGKFGLGLKTASLSQGRRLTVATRSSKSRPIRVRRWDLDHVAKTDSWLVERLTPSRTPSILTELLAEHSGTVVLWQNLDRILGSRRLGEEAVIRRLERAADDVAQHLSMVFHRFLAGETLGPPLSIWVNGDRLVAWDPFARVEPLTKALPPQTLTFEVEGQSHEITVQPFVLPAQQHFTSPEAHERASGPSRWNRQQGLYVYRRDRLIQSGGWNRLRTLDEHSKLARVAMDIPDDADALFRINVAKMTIGIPDPLRPQLRSLLAGVVSLAQEVYRRRLVIVDGAQASAPPEEVGASSHPSRLSDQWPLVLEALNREFEDQPDVLDRVLVALANVRPEPIRVSAVG